MLTASRGFTLIEVLIVLTLVVILGSVRMAPDTNSTPRARGVLKENLFRMRDASVSTTPTRTRIQRRCRIW